MRRVTAGAAPGPSARAIASVGISRRPRAHEPRTQIRQRPLVGVSGTTQSGHGHSQRRNPGAAGKAQAGARLVPCQERTRPMIRMWRIALLAVLLSSAPAWGVTPHMTHGAPVTWSALSPAQQQLLAPMRNQWARLPTARQRALARGSRIWLHMSPAQRRQAQQRFRKWRRLTPQRRALLRRRWRQFRALPAPQRAAIRRSFRQFERLPAWRRQRLRQRWENATPAQRQLMIAHMRQRMLQRRMIRQHTMRLLRPTPSPGFDRGRFGPGGFSSPPGNFGGIPGGIPGRMPGIGMQHRFMMPPRPPHP